MAGEDPVVAEGIGVEEPLEKDPEAVVHKESTGEDFADNDPKMKSANGEVVELVEDEDVKAKFPIREVSVSLPFFKDDLKFNWLVSILGLGVLWGIAIFCMSSPDASTVLGEWYTTTIELFTWFYILGKRLLYSV